MDAGKKVETEKRIVLGLAALFVVALCLGPLKRFGIGRRQRPPSLVTVPATGASASLAETMQKHWHSVDAASPERKGSASPAGVPRTGPVYTAQNLRDPFQSLLPNAPVENADGMGAAPKPQGTGARAVARPPAPPPALRVEGLIWGGSEPRAIIDGAVYTVHEAVHGMQILAIDHQGVTVAYDGKPVFYPAATAGTAAKQTLRR